MNRNNTLFNQTAVDHNTKIYRELEITWIVVCRTGNMNTWQFISSRNILWKKVNKNVFNQDICWNILQYSTYLIVETVIVWPINYKYQLYDLKYNPYMIFIVNSVPTNTLTLNPSVVFTATPKPQKIGLTPVILLILLRNWHEAPSKKLMMMKCCHKKV